MTEQIEAGKVTQADRDAAASWNAEHGGCCNVSLSQAFAAHRIAGEQAIVAWLRERAEVHRSQWAVSIDPVIADIADAIERGEHLKDTP